ncbi:MAG: hypothetical protein LCH37_14870 [Bacteroidetes bacterium]|nr:hypothetical protein [Bacteroidota bacterium]
MRKTGTEIAIVTALNVVESLLPLFFRCDRNYFISNRLHFNNYEPQESKPGKVKNCQSPEKHGIGIQYDSNWHNKANNPVHGHYDLS